jgi:hypothetical protein
MADPPDTPSIPPITSVQVTDWAYVGADSSTTQTGFVNDTLTSNPTVYYNVPSSGQTTFFDPFYFETENQLVQSPGAVLAEDGNLILTGDTEYTRSRTYYDAFNWIRNPNNTNTTLPDVTGYISPSTNPADLRPYNFTVADIDDLWNQTSPEVYTGGGDLTMDGVANINNGINVLTRSSYDGEDGTVYGAPGSGAGVLTVNNQHVAIGAWQDDNVNGTPHGRGFNGLYADPTQTVITGGTGTTTMVLDDDGVTIGSTSTPNNLTVTGATTLNGVDHQLDAWGNEVVPGRVALVVNGSEGTQHAVQINSNGSTRALDVNGGMHLNANKDAWDNPQTTLYADGNGIHATGNGAKLTVNGAGTTGYAGAELTNANGKGLKVYSDRTVLSGGSASTSLTLDNNKATFKDDANNGAPIVVSGIADGTGQYDAVNYGQVASAYSSLKRDIKDVENKAYGGIAAAVALAGIPAPAAGKQYTVGAGWGNYEGENAFALGGRAQITPEFQLTAGWGYSSEGNAFNVGAGYSW